MGFDLKLISSLKRLYWLLTGPAMAIFVCLFAARNFGSQVPDGTIRHLPEIWPAIFFTGAAVTAIAGPVMIRVLFAHKVRQNSRVPKALFLTFQRQLIIVSGITPYLALAAVWSGFSEFHAGGIILMALYAAYYYFPSEKRISHDIKMFRVALP
nr:hypothetical protein [uncultured Desulfobacter sp.]